MAEIVKICAEVKMTALSLRPLPLPGTSVQLTTFVVKLSRKPSAAAAFCFSSLYFATSASSNALLQVALASSNVDNVVTFIGMVVLTAMVVFKQAACAVAPSPKVNVPSGQARHTVALVAAPPRDQKPDLHMPQSGPPKPGLQPLQRILLAPTVVLLPLHALQAGLAVSRAPAETEPAAHSLQAGGVAPGVSSLPAGQALQVIAALLLVVRPRVQLVHLVLPARAAVLPTGQAVHVAMLFVEGT